MCKFVTAHNRTRWCLFPIVLNWRAVVKWDCMHHHDMKSVIWSHASWYVFNIYYFRRQKHNKISNINSKAALDRKSGTWTILRKFWNKWFCVFGEIVYRYKRRIFAFFLGCRANLQSQSVPKFTFMKKKSHEIFFWLPLYLFISYVLH